MPLQLLPVTCNLDFCLLIVEVIRCIKRENAWIKCKVENIYLIEKCNNK